MHILENVHMLYAISRLRTFVAHSQSSCYWEGKLGIPIYRLCYAVVHSKIAWNRVRIIMSTLVGVIGQFTLIIIGES